MRVGVRARAKERRKLPERAAVAAHAASPLPAAPRLRRTAVSLVLAALVGFGAAAAAVVGSRLLSDDGTTGAVTVDPCSIVSRAEVARTVGGSVLNVARIPVAGQTTPTLCAYTTSAEVGMITVSAGQVGTAGYRAAKNEGLANPGVKPGPVVRVGGEALLAGDNVAFVAGNGRYAQLSVQHAGKPGLAVLDALVHSAASHL